MESVVLLFFPVELVGEAAVGGGVAGGRDADNVAWVGRVVCPLEAETDAFACLAEQLAGNGYFEALLPDSSSYVPPLTI